MKLYILNKAGIVKIGITKQAKVNYRVSRVNNNTPKEEHLKLICDFEVTDNASMVERLIHEYLGINQLNIQYLKNKLILANVEDLESNKDGYTEYFLADKNKIKQAIILFGILGYINIDLDKLNKLDAIQEYTFDFFAENYSKFLDICEPINNGVKKSIRSANLQVSVETIGHEQIKADFSIENNQYYLTLNDKKIHISELTKPKNLKYVAHLLANKENLIIEKKEIKTLYSMILELRQNNKETSIQPLTSMQKELKEAEFYEFMKEYNCYERVKEFIEPWHTEGLFAYELLGYQSQLNQAIEDKFSQCKGQPMSYGLKLLEKEKSQLENPNILKPNFSSQVIFPEYLSLIEKETTILNTENNYNAMLQSVKMISSIFRILYNSKDKAQELTNIELFMDCADHFHRYHSEPNNTQPIWEIENQILTFMKKDRFYIELAEAVIKADNVCEYTEKVNVGKLNSLLR
jgi:hypothetical protein